MKAKGLLPPVPNYHRQRFLLLLLEASGGTLTKMDMQKLLFLSQQEIADPYYDFVPYFYGCYSFQAQSDIDLLESRGWVQTVGRDIRIIVNSVANVPSDNHKIIGEFTKKHVNFRGRKLIRYVYEKYPYYAIHSKMAKDILDQQTFDAVSSVERELKSDTKELFTIGYEGLTFEKYVNQLIQNDVRVLCDIRNNPLSRKFGFSKGMLSSVLPKLGIEYVHLPELGVDSEKRSGLKSKADYDDLFRTYRKTLPEKKASLESLLELFDKNRRIALTCFEKQSDSCHRHCVSEHIEETRKISAVHL